MKKSIPWIAFGIALVALAITLLHLCGYFQSKNCADNNLNDIIGIVVSSAAFVVSIFFIILGLHARQIKREYDEDIKIINKNIDILQNEVTKMVSSTSDTIYSHYSELLLLR